VPELDAKFINETLKLTDEMLAEYEGADTVEKYRAYVRAELTRQHEEELRSIGEEAMWYHYNDAAKVIAYPEDAVMFYYDYQYDMYSYYAAMYGMDYNTFLTAYMNGSPEDLFEFCKEAIKEEMVYYAVFEVGNYTFTDEQYARALDLYTEQNYAILEAEMLAAGREEFTVEEARDYFDRTYKSQLELQCLEESAFNDLIASATVVLEGAPETEDSVS
jgi:FKBP-type peptidyl-prolyl cis-trans isomerase (trigger factor)